MLLGLPFRFSQDARGAGGPTSRACPVSWQCRGLPRRSRGTRCGQGREPEGERRLKGQTPECYGAAHEPPKRSARLQGASGCSTGGDFRRHHDGKRPPGGLWREDSGERDERADGNADHSARGGHHSQRDDRRSLGRSRAEGLHRTMRALSRRGCKGDGAGAAGLDPKPRDHTDGAYMNARTDDQLLEVIKNGKGNMPAWAAS